MEYGLMININDTEKLDGSGIEWTFWDAEAIVFGDITEEVEIVFETVQDRARAMKLIKQK
ncbi:hypothetical protein D3C73_278230 [compost metagenome]